MEIKNWLKLVLDSLYDGILIADKNGKVLYVNPAYTRITTIKSEAIINKKLLEIRPGSHLTNVIKSGEKELGIHRKVGDIEYVVNMVPIYSKGSVLGGVSILNEINDIYNLTEKLKISRTIIQHLKENVKDLRSGKYFFEDIIAHDKKSLEIKEFSMKIARGDSNVLITGESGTGKELYASAIHNYSSRKDGPFIAINCASFEKNLIESELFGYEEGTFTGAKKNGKIGLFQLAHNGTIFLDEIGELEYSLQGKLLRVIQEKSIRKIGGAKEIPIDVRFICATNRDLELMIEKGEFRRDLYYRINTVPIVIPPLKERREDIPFLCEKFLQELNFKYKKNIILSKDVEKILKNYEWNGNIRELKNTLEFMYNIAEKDKITDEYLPKNLLRIKEKIENLDEETEILPLKEVVKELEKNYIKKILKLYNDDSESKKIVAKKLGISLATLYNKLQN